ncbi:NUDIX hydrolase [Catelliglobosispora koreensis]|uniref:NUDIX hydrolase n=1 Tax=Catelliglobosispora koreensis TaxID=129052 RepID=UPI000373D3DC|nr:NUDIX domain-containing protein [Catelliglobosispora koreensis]
MEPKHRVAARILLVDADDRVLLFRGFDPAAQGVYYWFTPGGGLDDGEDFTAGALRELREETGLVVSEVGEPVHSDVTRFSFNGVTYRQEQMFYLVRVAQWTVDSAGFDDYERDTIDEARWFSLSDLGGLDEAYYPQDLIEVLKKAGVAEC